MRDITSEERFSSNERSFAIFAAQDDMRERIGRASCG